jgi:hypothetical protein
MDDGAPRGAGGEDWVVDAPECRPHLPFADAAVRHRITYVRKVIFFPLNTLWQPDTMRVEVLCQLTIYPVVVRACPRCQTPIRYEDDDPRARVLAFCPDFGLKLAVDNVTDRLIAYDSSRLKRKPEN